MQQQPDSADNLWQQRSSNDMFRIGLFNCFFFSDISCLQIVAAFKKQENAAKGIQVQSCPLWPCPAVTSVTMTSSIL